MSAFNASFSCGGGGTSGPTGTITSLVPPTDNIGEEGNLYIQFGIGGAKNRLYLKQDGVWVQYSGPRNVLTLNGVSQYAVAPRVEEIDLDDPNLEIEIEWRGVLHETGNYYIVCDGGYGGYAEIQVGILNQNGYISFIMGGISTILSVPTDYAYLSFDSFRVVASSPDGTVDFYINSNLVSTKTINIGTNRVLGGVIIGARWGGDANSAGIPYQGQLSNIRIWTGGDRNTGTLTRHYRMDEGWRGANNQVLVNYATELGEELVTVSLPYDTPRIGETGNTYNNTLVASTNLPFGTTVISSFSLESYAGSESISWAAANPIRKRLNSNGTTGVSAAEIKSGVFHLFSRDTNEATVTDVSIKQADGYGTYIGLTEASWSGEAV